MGKILKLGLEKQLETVSRVTRHPSKSSEESGAESNACHGSPAQEMFQRGTTLATGLTPFV